MKFYKVMWVPNSVELVWDMEKEEEMPLGFYIYDLLNSKMDMLSWSKKFELKYKNWLNDIDHDIYDISSTLHAEVIKTIRTINDSKLLKSNDKLYYWFDVDRDTNDNYEWVKSPISKSTLQQLTSFPAINRNISEKDYMVFPS